MVATMAMSKKERERLQVVPQVVSGERTLRSAASCLGLSTRQVRRVVQRYLSEGDAGLVHRSRGRASGRALPLEIKRLALEVYAARYGDYPPTHASEAMARDPVSAVCVHPETLRLWLKEAGLWRSRVSRRRHRTWRARKARFGELVQLDGSQHAWFEGRAPVCYQMTLVDDATGETLTLFAEQETTAAAMAALEAWIRRYGIPRALYLDRKSVYVTDREPTQEEQLSGQPALTQFGRACRQLGIQLIEAHSPQAKGRVERRHGDLQERQVRDMRQAGIADIASANAFLPAWLEAFNRKYARAPRDPRDAHRPLHTDLDLRKVFCHQETRRVGNDWTIRFRNRRFQILRQPNLPPAGRSVQVQEWRDHSIHVCFRDRELLIREVPLDPPPKSTRPRKSPQVRAPQAEDHSWRTGRYLPIDTQTVLAQREDLAQTYLPTQTVAGHPIRMP